MHRHTKITFALIVAFLSFCTFTANAACRPPQFAQMGTVDCPLYTAPATTAVPGASMDGSTTILGGVSTLLFNGAVPPNGFMVQANGATCWVNDNGSASGVPGTAMAGFELIPAGSTGGSLFVTPPGYKPMGVVSMWCASPGYIAARGW
jgi:hypothetical protein